MSTWCAACDREFDSDSGGRAPEVCPSCGGLGREARLGAYSLTGLIRRGGMAAVYRAEHAELGTPVAVKVLDSHPENVVLRERFAREARMAARVSHPGVVKVYDFDVLPQGLYLVMELVEGPTLRELIDRDPIPVARCLEIAADLADVLEAAHAAGVVHRDIKPENVVIDRRGAVRVLDFGIARAREDAERLTRTGEILGTPEYMAPEQILEAPEAVGPHTDVYAIGVVLYEMLTACSPFSGANVFQALKYVEALEPPPPSSLRAGVESGIDVLVGRAIAKEPSLRPRSAASFALALRDMARTGAEECEARPRRNRARPVFLLLLAALLLAPSGVWLAQLRSERATDEEGLEGGHAADVPVVDRVAAAVARLRAGDQVRALEDLDQAVAEGRLDAVVARAVAWHLVHALPARVMPRLRWLGVPDQSTFHRYFELESAALPEQDASLLASAAALARGEPSGALASLGLLEPKPEHEEWASILRILALHADGRAEAARAEWERRFATGAHPILGRFLEVMTAGPPERSTLMPLLISELDRTWPDRYQLEALCAYETGDLARLRAATELALVTGAGDRSLVFHAAARCVPADSSSAELQLDGEACTRLIRRLEAVEKGSVPGLEVVRLLLAVVAGDEIAVESRLRELPDLTHPALRPFLACRDAVEAGSPVADLLRGLLCLQLGWTEAAEPRLEGALVKAREDAGLGALVKSAFLDSGPDRACVRNWLESRRAGTVAAAEARVILAEWTEAP